MSKLSKIDLTASEPKSSIPIRLDMAKVLECSYGQYPWDDWQRWAIAQGVTEDIADLGRSVIREAYQHGWSERLQSLCGWRDDGQRMVKLALHSPEKARKQWDHLLEADGR